jgi:UDP-glucose:(heptosyl)LPS alpha-1,3-glucosyltransferase
MANNSLLPAGELRVALVRYRYSFHGGAERYLDELVSALLSEGAQVLLLSSHWEGGKASAGIRVMIPVPWSPKWLRPLLFARAVRKWGRKNPDWLLFSLERIPGAAVYRAGDGCHAEWLRRKRPLRPVTWPLDFLRPLNLAYLYLEKSLFASETLKSVISISARGKEEIIRRFGMAPEKISVVYHGVRLPEDLEEGRWQARAQLQSRFGIGKDEPVFLFVGSGFRRKGVGVLLEAVILLATKGFPFRVIVVGKGNAQPYLRRAVRGGADGRIFFTGPVAGAGDFYLGADAFLFPTIYEPFGIVCLEAMAYGLPVVTTRVCGASEVLREGESGYILEDPFDPVSLSDRMEKLLDKGRRQDMGKAARKTAESMPKERNVRETLAVLAEVWRRKKET